MNNKFGMDKEETIWDKYCKSKEWIVITGYNFSQAGQCNRIENDFLMLNPHQGFKPTEENKLELGLVYKDSGVRIENISKYSLTDEKTIILHSGEENKANQRTK